MVLATDMSLHFQQVKQMRKAIASPETMDKGAVMSYIVHTADISHPTKNWELHERWTAGLVEEFFRQGDAERELGIPFSPLCDRDTTMVSQSQIGFIDFIIKPTYAIVTQLFDAVSEMLLRQAEALLLENEKNGIDDIVDDAMIQQVNTSHHFY
jgi:calcium/calmodulin-dependent 3',5'-cyclic nucleotide phosphodiesterase